MLIGQIYTQLKTFEAILNKHQEILNMVIKLFYLKTR